MNSDVKTVSEPGIAAYSRQPHPDGDHLVWLHLPAQSGAVCAVMRDPQTVMKHAGADPRREAYALGW